MSFFNKKEEVYHIELTPYGRYLLSIGKLKPHHYRFFDDDILYDSSFAEFTEGQNQVHDRVLNETPKVKPNGNMKGVLTSFKKLNGATEVTIGPSLKKNRKELNEEVINNLTSPIGTFKNSEQNTPSIQVDFFNGEISSSSKTLDYGAGSSVNIPQIDVDVEYFYSIKNAEDVITNTNQVNYETTYYSDEIDGKVIEVVPKIPLIRIKSEGTFDEIKNYDLEIYKATSGSAGYAYNKLKFAPKFDPIQNGILVDTNEVTNFSSTQNNPETVEYFFEIDSDYEIPNEVLCETLGQLKIRNIYLDKKIDCEEYQNSDGITSLSPYSSKVSVDDLKDC
ncbi:hypothetical protein N8467_00350 [bacterium]|nr:hypothetical protein [bacterium]